MNRDSTNYFAWGITIVAAVTIGNLLSNYITSQYAAYVAREALMQFGKSTSQQTAKAMNEMRGVQGETRAAAEAFQAKQQELRRHDALGTNLARQCMEWSQASDQVNSPYALQAKNRHCHNLEQYVTYGARP